MSSFIDASDLPIEARIYSIKTSDMLLSSASYQKLIKDIDTVTYADKEVIEVFYKRLIYKFAAYVQLLPEPQSPRPKSMLMASMRRAFLMLRAFSNEMHAVYGRPYLRSSEGSRLLFAVFSAALLFEIGKICANRKILITDNKGSARGEWNYFDKGLRHYGEYYKIRYGEGMPPGLTAEITYIIAKNLMPELGFSWLAEDFFVLQQWFIALTVRDEFFGAYKIDYNVTEDLEKAPLELEDLENNYEVPAEMLEIEMFWRWLREKIAKDKNKINDGKSGIYIVDGELAFDHNKLMNEFGQIYSNFTGVVVLAQQYNHLGLVPLSGYDYKFSQYFSMPVKGAGAGIFGATGQQQVNPGETITLMGIDKNTTAFYFGSVLKDVAIPSANMQKVPDMSSSPVARINTGISYAGGKDRKQ